MIYNKQKENGKMVEVLKLATIQTPSVENMAIKRDDQMAPGL